MTDQKPPSNHKYRVMQLHTEGWKQVDPTAVKLTKAQCDQWIRDYLDAGVPPNRVKVFLDDD